MNKKGLIISLTIFLAFVTGIFILIPASARQEQNNPPSIKGGKGGLPDEGLSNTENEDIQGIMKALEDREREISRREDALRKEEERLNMLKNTIELSLKEYSAMRDRLQKEIQKNNSVNNQSQQGMDHVIKIYEAMSPDEAAQRIEKMDNGMAVELLSKIKSKKAGKILEAMPMDKAALLTEEIAAKKGDK